MVGTRTACAGCGRERRIHSRGLCRGCWDQGEVRAARPDRRRSEALARSDPGARNALLLDPSLMSSALLAHLATRVARRFGRWVDAEDLIQEGWLVLVRAAATYRGRGKTLVHYCAHGLRDAMTRFALRTTPWKADGTVDPDTLSTNLRLGDEPLRPPYVTKHAAHQYRKRVDPRATAGDVLRHLRQSRPVPLAVPGRPGDVAFAADGVVFVVRPESWKYSNRLAVVNVLTGATP